MRFRLRAVVSLDNFLNAVNSGYLKERKSLFNPEYFLGVANVLGRLNIRFSQNRDYFSRGIVGFEIFGYFVDLFRRFSRDWRR